MRSNLLAGVVPAAILAALSLGMTQAVAQPAMNGIQAGTGKLENGKQAGDFMVRLRGIAVVPDGRARIDTVGGNTDISNEYVPEVDFSYFMTDSLALELIAGTTRHDVTAVDTAVGDVDLGKVSLLPPTLMLQWHVAPDYFISPYLGAGVNYTLFYNADAGSDIDKINYDNSLG